jgi:hypothetical protein
VAAFPAVHVRDVTPMFVTEILIDLQIAVVIAAVAQLGRN